MKRSHVAAWTGAAILTTTVAGGLALSPVVEEWVVPYIVEKLDTEIHGQVSLGSIHWRWNGTVELRNIDVRDAQGQSVVAADALRVQLALPTLVSAALGRTEVASAVRDVVLVGPHVHLRQTSDGTWNVETLRTTTTSSDTPFAFRGTVRIEDGLLDAQWGDGLSAHTELEGSVSFGSYPAWSGHLVLRNTELSTPTYRIPDAAASLTLGGTFSHPIVDGIVALRVAEPTGAITPTAGAHLHYEQGIVQVSHLSVGQIATERGGDRLRLQNDPILLTGDATSPIAGQLWYDTQTQDFEGFVALDKFDVTPWASWAGLDAEGTITGAVHVRGSGASVSEATVSISDVTGRYARWRIAGVRARAVYRNGLWDIPYAVGQWDGGAVSLRLREEGGLHGILSFDHLPLHVLRPYVGTSIEGTGSGYVLLGGSRSQPTANFHLGALGLQLHGLRFLTAHMQGRYDGQKVLLEQAELVAPSGVYRGSGSFALEGNQEIDFEATVQNARLEDWAQLAGAIPATGWISSRVHVAGTRTAPQVEGTLTWQSGSFYGELVDDVHARFSYREGMLTIPEIVGHMYGATLTGAATLQGDALDAQLQARSIRPGRFLTAQGVDVDGPVDIDGQITGTWQQPRFRGRIEGAELRINGAPAASVHGMVSADKQHIAVEGFEIVQGKGRYRLQGGMRLPEGQLFGRVEAEQGDVGALLQMAGVPLHDVTGALQGYIDVGGTWRSPRLDVVGTIHDTTMRGRVTGTSTLDATFQRNEVHIKKLRIPTGDGSFLAAQGTARLDGDVAMQVVASHVPVETLLAITGQAYPVTGELEGILNVTGQTQSPTLQVSAAAHKLGYHGTELDHVYLLANIADGVIHVNQVLAERGPYKAKLYGTIPYEALYAEATTGRGTSMDLTLDLDQADLGVLPLFSPLVASGNGRTRGKLHLTGPLHDVAVEGTVTLDEGRIQLHDLKEPLEHIQLRAHFEGKYGEWELGTQLGEGGLRLSGHAYWDHNQVSDYGLHLRSNGATATSPYFTGPIDLNVAVVPSVDKPELPLITGRLNLDGTTINVPMNLGGGSTDIQAALDLDIEAASGMRLYNPLLYDLDILGRLHLGQTWARPHTEGRFTVQQGTIKYLNNHFTVSEGIAEFNQPGSFLPNITLRANTSVQAYRVQLGIDGPVTGMQLTLQSEPALTEQQIISLLTVRALNFNTQGIEKTALNAVVTAGLQMALLGKLENTLRDTLGVDQFTITSNYLDPYAKKRVTQSTDDNPLLTYYSLEVGKQLLPNLTVSVGTGLNYPLSRFGIAYRVSQHIDFDAWTTTDHNSYAGIQYKYRF